MRELNMVQAIAEAISEEMERDERVLTFGQSARSRLYGTTSGLAERFQLRIRDTPIIENTIAGIAIGAALTGQRPVIETNGGFLAAGYEETVHLPSHWRLTHGAKVSLPMVIILNAGGRWGGGADHAQFPVSTLLHYSGLKIALPTTPYDAKGLLKTAIRDDNPVFFVHHGALAATRGPVPEEDYAIPFGVAEVRRQGRDVSVVGSSYPITLALAAARDLAPRISVEVVDLRTLEPLDVATIVSSARKTGRVVVVDDDTERVGVVAELSAIVMERAFDALRAPVVRVGRRPVPLPGGVGPESSVMPTVASITDAIERAVQYAGNARVPA